jgi:Tfp pilus assembly protein PilF
MEPCLAPARALAFALVLALATSLLGACALLPNAPGLVEISERPAEKALLAGLRAYDDAQYPLAEQQLKDALKAGLAAPRDRAAAHKHLAFIYCTSARVPACEAEFRAARADDPAFALSKAEAGHPQWGPVWQRLRQ